MSKKLTVFFLHNVVSPYRLPIFEELNQSVELDVNFCIARTSDRKWNTSLNGYSFKHTILKSIRLGPFIINPNLLNILFRNSYDVYLVGDFPETVWSTFMTILVAKLRHKPVVLWSETTDNNVIYFQNLALSHNTIHRMILAVLSTGIGMYRKILHTTPDTIAALSHRAHAFLIAQNVPANKIFEGIQVYPCELLDQPDSSKLAKLYNKKTVLLYLGYLNALKGIDHLVLAMKYIPDPNIQLLIVGDGPQKECLKELAKNDDRIEFTGYTEGIAKANLMRRADLLILPTLADCWGMVINESLYYGTPVVASAAAGATEIIQNNVNGKIIPPGNPQALAAMINELTQNKQRLQALKRGAANTSTDITNRRVGAKPLIDAITQAGATV